MSLAGNPVGRTLTAPFAVLAVALLLAACAAPQPSAPGSMTPSGTVLPTGARTAGCTPTATQIQGPYFADGMPARKDIRPDSRTGVVQDGMPLVLRFTVRHDAGGSCRPLAGALVDVWHANVAGDYSAYAVEGTQDVDWLRGNQLTDRNGTAEFATIYPGWYPGRTMHIHVKVRAVGVEWTSQLYADDAVSREVYAKPPYAARGQADTTNARDGWHDEALELDLRPDGAGYVGSYAIVV